MKKILLSLMIMMLTAPSLKSQAGIFNPETFELKNGLKVIVVPNKRSRSGMQIMLWYPYGSSDEKKNKHGLAHFLEHLMFRGTHLNGPGKYDAIVSGFGGENNAFTSWDFTGYYVKVSKEFLEPILALEADRICKHTKGEGLKIIDEVFKPEKLVVLEEMTTSYDNNPSRVFDVRLREVLFKGHPYAVEIIGPRKEVEALSAQDAMDFYNDHYGIENVTLIIEGNVTKNDMQPLVEKYFGNIKGKPRKPRLRQKTPDVLDKNHIIVEHPLVTQEKMVRYYKAPSYQNASSKEMLTLEVLQNLLGGTDISHLYKDLVINQKKAAQISISFNASLYDANVFAISAIPSDGIALSDLEKSVDQSLEKFLNTSLSEKDLTRTKNRMKADSIYARDGLGNGAEIIGITLTVGGSLDDIEKMNDTLDSITHQDVMAMAKRILKNSLFVSGHLIAPKKGASKK